MIRLLGFASGRDRRGLDGDPKPQGRDGAPEGPQRSGGRRPAIFFGLREEGRRPGKKVVRTRLHPGPRPKVDRPQSRHARVVGEAKPLQRRPMAMIIGGARSDA